MQPAGRPSGVKNREAIRVKVQIALPKEIIEKVDESRKKTFETRSGWFAHAAKLKLEELARKNLEELITK